jgi:hypothetical protein
MRGSRPGERRGGRRKGTRNRSTIERALVAEQIMKAAEAAGVELAKQTLDRFKTLFAELSFRHAPATSGAPVNKHADEAKFEKYARLAIECAKALAPFQSPQLRAIVVSPAPEQPKGERVTRFTLKVFEQRAPLPGSNGSGERVLVPARIIEHQATNGQDAMLAEAPADAIDDQEV